METPVARLSAVLNPLRGVRCDYVRGRQALVLLSGRPRFLTDFFDFLDLILPRQVRVVRAAIEHDLFELPLLLLLYPI